MDMSEVDVEGAIRDGVRSAILDALSTEWWNTKKTVLDVIREGVAEAMRDAAMDRT
jgi:hypothetical protein